MVLGFFLDHGLKASFWLCQKTYDGAIYLYYGKQETNEEKILRELKELKAENKDLRSQLQLLLVNSHERDEVRSESESGCIGIDNEVQKVLETEEESESADIQLSDCDLPMRK